jgi:SAM-dependent methyltransferase
MYPAQKCMVDRLVDDLAALLVSRSGRNGPPCILNIGAVENENIEWELLDRRINYVCDRIDVQGGDSFLPTVRTRWTCSVEAMSPAPSGEYDAVVANWIFEHVADLAGSAAEIARVLGERGLLFATVPNPRAIEFLIARITPLWFHGLIRGERTLFPKYYAYRSIEDLVDLFQGHCLRLIKIDRGPCWEVYLWKYPVLRLLARAMDWLLQRLPGHSLLGHVYLVFEKSLSPSAAAS